MIARTWKGRTPASRAAEYLEYLKRTGLAEYRATPGNRGILVLQRAFGEDIEFTLISFWESLEAIQRFAGPDISRAVYYQEDAAFLRSLSTTVEHHDVVLDGTELDLRAGHLEPGPWTE